MKKQLKADLMLILVALFWGGSYILTKVGLEEIQVFNLIALRFILAFLLAAVVFYKRLATADFKTIKYAFFLAVILFSVFITATFGVKYTTVSNAGFLISLTVVLVPIISSLFLKQKPEKKVVIAICLAFVGIILLTLNEELRINKGDILCIMCALLYALHIITTGLLTADVDSVSLGVIQLGFVGLFSIAFSLSIETVKLPSSSITWFAVIFLSVFCTAIAFIVQTTAQQYTTATHTGLIFALEPVFSAVFAYIFIGETLSLRGYIGATILLVSIIVAELDFNALLSMRHTDKEHYKIQ
ncbi:Permease of the drug/metabolite transporter (DMT) superfamily [Natronincola peptidivorans]|uniref:Permease of the drug/metabolite transporter (DMT) superfamily n=1 Tax=Natronincola peptidivorans TaxID=426128 RepID=A0A1I0DRN8_9FIRM|nr:DMT family transporter [Natronincola peptidivorans]SET34846.1 Permease of the drug/metabolite transporter (DMT) superfamily [Natronincola peptidivorans]